jgi:rfaE bifunctional protein nucleotidyltransferase chain/domain
LFAKSRHRRIVFTNGCFDIIHAGHIRLLEWAKRQGDLLIVALNSDRSVRAIKGSSRPIMKQRERCVLLAALECVDYVTIFYEPTPQRLISRIQPDVLVKGADWGSRDIVGSEIVERKGGCVLRAPILKGHSTTQLIRRMQAQRRAQ